MPYSTVYCCCGGKGPKVALRLRARPPAGTGKFTFDKFDTFDRTNWSNGETGRPGARAEPAPTGQLAMDCAQTRTHKLTPVDLPGRLQETGDGGGAALRCQPQGRAAAAGGGSERRRTRADASDARLGQSEPQANESACG